MTIKEQPAPTDENTLLRIVAALENVMKNRADGSLSKMRIKGALGLIKQASNEARMEDGE